MTSDFERVLTEYSVELENACFHKRSNRLDVILRSNVLMRHEICAKLKERIVSIIPRTCVTFVNVSITCPNARDEVINDFDNAVVTLKTYAMRIRPECSPIIAMSVWELQDETIHVSVPEKFQKIAQMALNETMKSLRLGIDVEILGNDEIKYDIDFANMDLMKQNKNAARLATPKTDKSTDKSKAESVRDRTVIMGKAIQDSVKIIPMVELKKIAQELLKSEKLDAAGRLPGKNVTVRGRVIPLTDDEAKRRTQNPARFRQVIADETSAVILTTFKNDDTMASVVPLIEQAQSSKKNVVVRGKLCINERSGDYYIIPYDICSEPLTYREDTSEFKRVELHLHTTMSQMDALTKSADAISTAARWGHNAIAITDHGVAHAFPEAMGQAQKAGVKLLYGLEGYLQDDCELIDDYDERTLFVGDFDYSAHKAEQELSNVVNGGQFAVVSAGVQRKRLVSVGIITLNVLTDKHFIEIAAYDHDSKKTFHVNINTGIPIPVRFEYKYDAQTMSMAPSTEEALREFAEFMSGAVAIVHDDTDYLSLCHVAKRYGIELDPRYIDTCVLAHYMFPKTDTHTLDDCAKTLLDSERSNAQADNFAYPIVELTSKLYTLLCTKLKSDGCPISLMHGREIKQKKTRRGGYYHIILLAKNRQGLKNMYKMISYSHSENFHGEPLIPRSLFAVHRDGIILGSACERGELFRAMLAGADDDALKKIARWYDYLEVQPIGNNAFMLRNGMANSEEALREFNKRIIRIGDSLGKMTVATGDVHFLEPQDSVYRAVIMTSMGFKDANTQAPLYFKPTQEMLAEFSYLGAEKAFEIVVTNPNLIAESCEVLTAYLNEQSTYAPVFEGANEELRSMSLKCVYELYGENLPEIVQMRLDKELHSIIDNGYATLYLMAQRLVFKSMSDGYLVGSRGSVGSSFVAYLAGITEINPLPAHYLCPKCHHCEFDKGEFSCGADMPDAYCTECGAMYRKVGFDIPFETFLGFKGDKTPDIDLNFSGEYHAVAHEYTRTMFGSDHAFRAGVISTLQDKTAYGYALKYCEAYDIDLTQAELAALVMGCVGVKQTTGQHPGGMVIIPEEYEAEDFLPLQYPANKSEGNNLITHFDFHAMHDKLVKLDILGHVDPTALRMLRDLTGLNPQDIPLDDPQTRALFSTNEPLGVDLSEIDCDLGVLGIPEYGTSFVRGILKETRPKTIEELVRIAGLSHGTNVWSGNAQTLIEEKRATLSNVIGTRDDIMRYLISVGCEPLMAFKTMESVRKGKGLTPEMETCLKALPLPSWYIDSCKKIKYMFPRAHAAAYLTMAFRVAYYKMHFPAEYYAVYFSTRAPDFDVMICRGDAATVLRTIKKAERDIRMQSQKNGKRASTVDDESGNDANADKLIKLIPILEIVYEMNLRNIRLLNIDINRSSATTFTLASQNELLPPFSSIGGLGATIALQIVEARNKRNGKPFTSIEDFRETTKVGKTVMAKLEMLGSFEGMADSDQITLF